MQPGCFPTVEFDRSKLMISIEVTLNADPTAISPVVEGIMEMARRLECAAGKEFEIETALREALANAIVHGCKNDPTKKVQCCVGCDEERGMLIVVRDQHAALFVASNAALDFLGGIVLATVNNGVGEGFAQRGFDLEFFPGGAFESARHLHDALNHGADGRGIGVERDLNAYHQFAAIELYRWKTAGLHGQVPQ